MDALAAQFPLLELRSFHLESTERCGLAGAGTKGLGPLVLRVGDDAVSVIPGDVVQIRVGEVEDPMVVVEFANQRAFSDFAHELCTAAGAHVSGVVRYPVGGFVDFDRWEPALRALYHGRPIFDPAVVDADEITRVFSWDAGEDDELADFLRRFGFAHVRGVFSTSEVAALDAAVTQIESEASPDLPDSWWTRESDGSEVACQLHYLGLKSPVIAALDHDERVVRLVELSGLDLRPHPDRMLGTFAVLKRSTAHEGLTNLGWHIDCGLGGHQLLCPGLHIGVQLTASNPAMGAFSVLAGSHASTVSRGAIDPETWPIVTIDAQPGDVTLHVPHALHAAPAPTERGDGRRTLYLGFGQPAAIEMVGEGRAFDDLLTEANADGHVRFDASTNG